jgi:DNA-binding transcriptional LysR family regulator
MLITGLGLDSNRVLEPVLREIVLSQEIQTIFTQRYPRQLRKNWPDLGLSFVQDTPQGLFNDLLEGTIDCAFATLQARRVELVSHKLSTMEVGMVLPPGHRLAASREIPFKELSDEPWILAPREDNPVLHDEQRIQDKSRDAMLTQSLSRTIRVH